MNEEVVVIYTNKFAMACALCTGLLWVICSVLVAFFPNAMLQMSAHMFHIDAAQINWQLTWYGFLLGLISWVIIAAIAGLLLAAIYNRLVCSEAD